MRCADPGAFGKIDPARAAEITRTVVREFFGQEILDQPSAFLSGKQPMTDVTVSNYVNRKNVAGSFLMKVSVKVFNRDGQLVGPLDLPPVEKSDEEWQATADARAVRRSPGRTAPNGRSAARCSTTSARASMPASAAGCRCLHRTPSSIPARAGRASSSRSPTRTSRPSRIAATAWCGSRSCVRAATAISATCSWTGRCRRGCGTA